MAGMLVAAVVCACGTSPASTTGTAVPHYLTRAAAVALITKYSAAFDRPDDAAAVTAITEGDEQTQDLATIAADRAAPPPPTKTTPRRVSIVAIDIPQETPYPAHFLGHYTAVSSNGTETSLVLFTKDTAQAPWRAASNAPVDSTAPYPDLKVDADGHGNQLLGSDFARYVMDGGSAAAAYAHYLEAGITGTAVGGFVAGRGTTGLVAAFKKYIADAARQGESATVHWAANPSTVGFLLADGSALVVATITRVEALTAAPGQVFSQDPARTVFGGLLAPGQYSEVTTRTICLEDAQVPVRGAKSKDIAVVALGCAPVEVSGVQ